MLPELNTFLEEYSKKGDRYVPARLQAAMALLERLREHPSLTLADHLSNKGSSGFKSQESYGNRVHDRLKLQIINKNHGRRSANLQDWGQALLNAINAAGFGDAVAETRDQIISDAQAMLAGPLRAIIEQEPIDARLRDRSAEAIIHDILFRADEKGKCGDVAQYLVGAKLSLRFKRDFPVYPANKSDRKSRGDTGARLGDFEIENAVIEVAVGLPDEKHIDQIAQILEESDAEVWLLTRADRVATWKNELKATEGIEIKRVVITSVEAFVGQNITEMGGFSAKGKASQLASLFDLYNSRWVDKVGTPGIRIVIPAR